MLATVVRISIARNALPWTTRFVMFGLCACEHAPHRCVICASPISWPWNKNSLGTASVGCHRHVLTVLWSDRRSSYNGKQQWCLTSIIGILSFVSMNPGPRLLWTNSDNGHVNKPIGPGMNRWGNERRRAMSAMRSIQSAQLVSILRDL